MSKFEKFCLWTAAVFEVIFLVILKTVWYGFLALGLIWVTEKVVSWLPITLADFQIAILVFLAFCLVAAVGVWFVDAARDQYERIVKRRERKKSEALEDIIERVEEKK